ncbi:conserved hypothetical protein [Vibrio chagasii]|nr:conserved hypothetical protein [Vibrio chagasii]
MKKNTNLAKSHFKQFLPALFEKIELGKPTHYKRFLLGLAESGVCPNEVEHIFHVVNIGKKRYRVTINPESYQDYKELRQKCLIGGRVASAKAVAASTGKSHSKSASGVMCVMHTEEFQINPCCVILEQGIPRELPKLKKKLLLIENFELFIAYKEILAYVNQKTNYSVGLDEFDVLYSQGSTILNKQYRPFLMGYDQIFCLFDIDFGGLIIYEGLRRFCSNAIFVVPNDAAYLIDTYGFAIPDDEEKKLKDLISNPNSPKIVKRVAKLMVEQGKKIEQEVYLLELDT